MNFQNLYLYDVQKLNLNITQKARNNIKQTIIKQQYKKLLDFGKCI